MQEEHFFVFVSSVLHEEQAAMAMLVKMERAVQIKIVPKPSEIFRGSKQT